MKWKGLNMARPVVEWKGRRGGVRREEVGSEKDLQCRHGMIGMVSYRKGGEARFGVAGTV